MKILFLIILLLPIFCLAQNDCKYDVDTYDQFMKIKKVEKLVKISSRYSGYMEINFCKYDTSIFFRLKAIRDDATVVGADDAFVFLLEDNSLVKAYPNQMYSGDISRVSNTITLDATYYFENKNDIEELKRNRVKSVRIYYNNVYSEYKIKDKFSEALFNTVKCF